MGGFVEYINRYNMLIKVLIRKNKIEKIFKL